MGYGLFPISSCNNFDVGRPTQHRCVKVVPGSPIVDKNGNRICGKALCCVCKRQWGSKISSFCCLNIEGHEFNTLTSPPMSSVVGHSIFLSPLLDVPLGEGSSSICSSKVSDNSNMLLSNIDSYVTSALAKDVYETTLINSAIFTDSSDTYEAFYLLEVGNLIAKQYLYDKCKSIAHHFGF